MEWYHLLLLVLTTSIVLWIPHNAQHELSHGFVARLYGLVLKEIKLWPGWSSRDYTRYVPWPVFWKKEQDWVFRFAFYRWHNPDPTNQVTAAQRARISAAPVAVNSVMITLLLIVNLLVADKIAASIFMGWMTCNFVDGTNNMRQLVFASPEKYQTSTTDMLRWVRYRDKSVGYGRATGIIWLVVAASLVSVGYVHLFSG